MLKFILLILIIFFIIFILGIGLLSRFIRVFTKQARNTNYGQNQNRSENRQNMYDSSDSRKVFGKEEGEYIDYEEIEKLK